MNDDLPPWVTEGPPDEEPERRDPPPLKTDALAQYEYRYADGSLAFIVARWDAHNGHKKKRFSPFCWNGSEWVAKQLVPAGGRPLFNLGAVDQNSKILVVEGEKTCISAAKLVSTGWVVVTWSGGSSAVSATDWSPLRNHEVVIWPDNDAPGMAASATILALTPHARIVDLPLDLPDGWDLGDPAPDGRAPGWVHELITGAKAERPGAEPPPNNPERGVLYGKLLVLSDADANAAAHRDYYLKGIFSPNELSAVYGEPGCGKSFWVLYIVRAITQGREVLGRRVHKTNCLFMALEGVSGFEKRLKAEIITNKESDGFYYIAQPVNLFDDAPAVEDTIKAIKANEAGILIIDTLNRALAGGSENAPEDMGQFIRNLDAIRAATGAHILLIHHSGKDAARGMRGHTALLGAADVVLEVVRDANTKARSVTVRKSKDDLDGGVFGFALTVKELGEDEDGDPITTCVVHETEGKKVTPLSKKEQHWLDTICQLFARSEGIQMVAPDEGMTPIPCATRDDLREWIKKRGLVGVAHSVAKKGVLSATDRSAFARILEALKIKNKLGIHGDWIWLVQ